MHWQLRKYFPSCSIYREAEPVCLMNSFPTITYQGWQVCKMNVSGVRCTRHLRNLALGAKQGGTSRWQVRHNFRPIFRLNTALRVNKSCFESASFKFMVRRGVGGGFQSSHWYWCLTLTPLHSHSWGWISSTHIFINDNKEDVWGRFILRFTLGSFT